ncbi:hypothetical protein [Arsenicicoccus dermatophilus]
MTPTSGVAVADHETARTYLATLSPGAAVRLEPYPGRREFRGCNAVFVAH